MKRIIATVGIIIVLFPSFNVRAADTASSTPIPDGKLTLAVLEQISSWEELYNTVHPISDDVLDTIENKEDYYCVLLIEGINQRKTIPYSDNEEYVSFSFESIKFEEIDIKRFLMKIDKIISIYNKFNDLRLVWEHWPLNKDSMQICVDSVNALTRPATRVGQRVFLKDYTVFWESAQYDGSGKHEKVVDNSFVPEDCIVTVNGYAYYEDATRRVISENYYVPFDELTMQEPEISHKHPRMYHVCTEDTDLGWVHAEDIIRVSD